jgi:hypothetical protein
MRPPRVQFTVRSLIVLIAVVAVLLWGYDRYGGMSYSVAYYVGDLVRSADGREIPVNQAELAKLAVRLKSETVGPDVWWLRRGSVTPFVLSHSLIVRLPPSGQRRAQDWLLQERRRLEGRR